MEIFHNYERDDRSDSFRMIADIVVTMAETKGVIVDELTHTRWRDLLALLREFDTFADDSGITPDAALLELKSFSLFRDNYPSLTPNSLGEETHSLMVRRVGKILHHSAIVQTAVNSHVFIENRRQEVDHTAELLADCATGNTTTQAGFYTQFMPSLREMGRAANFIDTIIDYRRDRREQKIAISPSQEFFVAIGKSALYSLSNSSHHLFHPPMARHFIDMSVMRLKNRFRHGRKSYSSLQKHP